MSYKWSLNESFIRNGGTATKAVVRITITNGAPEAFGETLEHASNWDSCGDEFDQFWPAYELGAIDIDMTDNGFQTIRKIITPSQASQTFQAGEPEDGTFWVGVAIDPNFHGDQSFEVDLADVQWFRDGQGYGHAYKLSDQVWLVMADI